MELSRKTDEELMTMVAGGDRGAFEVLAKRHLGRVYGQARCMVKGKQDAEDVAQDVFTRLWVYGPKWKTGEAAFTTWLHRIVANCCYDFLRKHAVDVKKVEVDDNIASGEKDQESGLAEREKKERVQRALQELPERQRMAVTLCYFQEMTNPEAAKVMDIHIKALEGLLVRARKALRPVLEEMR
jgi:RNA polymerase sigma-70 factor (ECF subfamily)